MLKKDFAKLGACAALVISLFTLHAPAQAASVPFDVLSEQEQVLDIPSLVRALNKDRTEEGLTPLRRDPDLDSAAAKKAADMVKSHYFAHTSPSGVTPWHWFEEINYEYEYAGENLALQYTSSEEVQKAWMASPKHRANILNPNYEEVGYAIASGDFREAGSSQLYRGIVIVQLFGKRSSLANIGEPLQSPAQVASQVLGKTNIFALGQINNIVEDIKTSVFAAPAPIINIKAKQTVAVAKSSKPEPPPEPIPVTAWPMLGLGLAVMVGTHHLTTRFFL